MSAPFKHIRDRETALAAEPPKMLVETIIPDGKLIIPWGDTGCGKTYWMTEIVTAVAMRRPVFGRFPVAKEGDPGLGVIFAGEDCDFLEQSRLVAIEQHFGRSLQGLVYTVADAMPVAAGNKMQAIYRDELRRLQDDAGKPIAIIGNDTLKRSLGALRQNEDDAARQFNSVMEDLAAEFACTVICNAHEPKYGASGNIAGSGDFTANCPVTPHLVARKGSHKRLTGIGCTFEPKFRVGPIPDPFEVRAIPVVLPKPVAGFPTDLVLVYGGSAVAAPKAHVSVVSTALLAHPDREFTTAELAGLLAREKDSERDTKQWQTWLNRNAPGPLQGLWRMERRGSIPKETRVWRAVVPSAAIERELSA